MTTFYKGHGTCNDFVLIPDPRAELDLPAERVAELCDRRAGIGGDGLIRVAYTQALLDHGELTHADLRLKEGDEVPLWCMDYRNADGSLAEMCGNGARVFGHFVAAYCDAGQEFDIATRAGTRHLKIVEASETDAMVEVTMGEVEVLGVSTCSFDDHRCAGVGIDVGNPHLACVIPDLTADELATLPIDRAPEFDHEFFPQGVNVEVVTPLTVGAGVNAVAKSFGAYGGDTAAAVSGMSDNSSVRTAAHEGSDDTDNVLGEISMRVHERGSGETWSCGTGTVAATVAALADRGEVEGTVRVNVRGGTVTVRIHDGHAWLTGPSAIVATGTIVM